VLSNIGAVADYFSEIDDIEGRSEIKTDAEKKIISYRDGDGVLHENIGIETCEITLLDDGVKKFQQMLKYNGYAPNDFSDVEKIELPEPIHYAILNLIVE
jgi:hypothetical protein